MQSIAIGADIGGSHIYSAAVDLSTHRIIPGTGFTQPVNNKAGASEILDGWSRAIAATMQRIDVEKLAGIGFAMPGPFDYPNGIALFERVEKYESLYGVNVSEELRNRLQLDNRVHFRYINDATAFAIAEAWVGKAGNFERLIALTLGTGFGSAFINQGIPVLQGDTVPEMGCVWHLPFKDSIANNYFSTHWFTGTYFERTGQRVEGVKDLAIAASTDAIAKELFLEYGRNMGHFIAPWIRKFDARVIVIGGNITGAFDLFGKHLEDALDRNDVKVDLLLSDLKEDAAVMGGARLLDENYWNRVKDLLKLM